MTTSEYTTTEKHLLDHYEELSLAVSRDPEVAKGNRQIAESLFARLRQDIAREALDGLAAEARARIANRETTWEHGQTIAYAAETYRDTHQPENMV